MTPKGLVLSVLNDLQLTDLLLTKLALFAVRGCVPPEIPALIYQNGAWVFTVVRPPK